MLLTVMVAVAEAIATNIDEWVQQATFSPKRATRRLRLVGHQPTRPVNCLLAKATHRNPGTSLKAFHLKFLP